MNIVLLSPHFPPNYYNFAVALNRLGVNVLGIGDQPYERLRPGLREALTEYYWVEDLHDYEQVLRACAYFTFHYGKLHRLESHNEYWLETDARLRTDFNIPGPKMHEIVKAKRKSQMKQVLIDAGLDVARGALVGTLGSAQRFIAEVGYPVVVKPDIGVGAADTHKLNSDIDLARFFAQRARSPASSTDYFMEEYIVGTVGSFDGLTDHEGHVVFHTAHRYDRGVMEIVNNSLDLIYYSLREIPKRLREAGLKAVEAFGLKERFFHIEFFHTDDDRWVVLEVNVRPPGGLTMDRFNYANDIDLYQEWANVVVLKQFMAEYTRPYHCAHISRRYIYRYRHAHADILRDYGPFVVFHGPLDPVLAHVMGDYVYLVRATDLEDIHAARQFIHAKMNDE
jgi:biotin carboxylase